MNYSYSKCSGEFECNNTFIFDVNCNNKSPKKTATTQATTEGNLTTNESKSMSDISSKRLINSIKSIQYNLRCNWKKRKKRMNSEDENMHKRTEHRTPNARNSSRWNILLHSINFNSMKLLYTNVCVCVCTIWICTQCLRWFKTDCSLWYVENEI